MQFKNKRGDDGARNAGATGLPARRLELEITETVLLQDTEAVMTYCIACTRSECGYRWTISAPAIRR